MQTSKNLIKNLTENLRKDLRTVDYWIAEIRGNLQSVEQIEILNLKAGINLDFEKLKKEIEYLKNRSDKLLDDRTELYDTLEKAVNLQRNWAMNYKQEVICLWNLISNVHNSVKELGESALQKTEKMADMITNNLKFLKNQLDLIVSNLTTVQTYLTSTINKLETYHNELDDSLAQTSKHLRDLFIQNNKLIIGTVIVAGVLIAGGIKILHGQNTIQKLSEANDKSIKLIDNLVRQNALDIANTRLQQIEQRVAQEEIQNLKEKNMILMGTLSVIGSNLIWHIFKKVFKI